MSGLKFHRRSLHHSGSANRKEEAKIGGEGERKEKNCGKSGDMVMMRNSIKCCGGGGVGLRGDRRSEKKGQLKKVKGEEEEEEEEDAGQG